MLAAGGGHPAGQALTRSAECWAATLPPPVLPAGVWFRDLPANLLGSFVIGLFAASSSAVRMIWAAAGVGVLWCAVQLQLLCPRLCSQAASASCVLGGRGAGRPAPMAVHIPACSTNMVWHWAMRWCCLSQPRVLHSATASIDTSRRVLVPHDLQGLAVDKALVLLPKDHPWQQNFELQIGGCWPVVGGCWPVCQQLLGSVAEMPPWPASPLSWSFFEL